jgi:hypothetical protein
LVVSVTAPNRALVWGVVVRVLSVLSFGFPSEGNHRVDAGNLGHSHGLFMNMFKRV